MIEIKFLGTSSMFPTKNRNHPGVLLKYNGSSLLFDCGEGIQRQLVIANEKITKINYIFISHWHGDHTIGLAGIIQSLSALQREKPLFIFGPSTTKKRVKKIIETFEFEKSFDIIVEEVNNFKKIKFENFTIKPFRTKHTIKTFGYIFKENDELKVNKEYIKKFGLFNNPIIAKLKEKKNITWKGNKIKWKDATYVKKGRKIVYIPDTAYFKKLSYYCKDADVIICESTFSDKLKEKAKEYMHLTAKQAGKIAKDANAKLLLLFHFSQRYKDEKVLEEEAKEVFPNTIAAKDFFSIEV